MSGPRIGEPMQRELCAKALEAQKACLDLFDRVEEGDLTAAVRAYDSAARCLNEVHDALRMRVALALAGFRAAGLPIPGEPR